MGDDAPFDDWRWLVVGGTCILSATAIVLCMLLCILPSGPQRAAADSGGLNHPLLASQPAPDPGGPSQELTIHKNPNEQLRIEVDYQRPGLDEEGRKWPEGMKIMYIPPHSCVARSGGGKLAGCVITHVNNKPLQGRGAAKLVVDEQRGKDVLHLTVAAPPPVPPQAPTLNLPQHLAFPPPPPPPEKDRERGGGGGTRDEPASPPPPPPPGGQPAADSDPPTSAELSPNPSPRGGYGDDGGEPTSSVFVDLAALCHAVALPHLAVQLPAARLQDGSTLTAATCTAAKLQQLGVAPLDRAILLTALGDSSYLTAAAQQGGGARRGAGATPAP